MLRQGLNRMATLAGAGLLAGALHQEYSKPAAEREGHGLLLGAVPYDFRLPSWERAIERLWNKDDKRLFTPTIFGVGWALNFARLFAFGDKDHEL